MQVFVDALDRFGQFAMTWTEVTSSVLLVLTGLLLALTYGLARQDWAEISAWASLATVALAIHFMVVGWRDMAIKEKFDMPVMAFQKPEGAGTAFKDCPECPEMVVIRSGLFVMGAGDPQAGPEEGPERKMMFADRFAIGRQAVTGAEFQAFIKASGTLSRACLPDGSSGPVQCVSWRDAQAYVAWLRQQTGKGFRLASAAEWEYAARAGAAAPSSPLAAGVIRASLAIAPISATNGFGVNGMGGGLAELVEDCWSPTLAELSSNGRALQPAIGWSCAGRVLKSGNAAAARFSGRRPIDEAKALPSVGFRVVREMAPLPK